MIPRVNLDMATQTKMEQDLMKFALQGLRTLVFSKKEMKEQDLNEFMRKYTELKTSVDPLKDKKLLELYDSLEYGLDYLGSSAIEDKLQENVATTIEHIMNANVRVWVLTGDKQETAIEIAKACRLIQEGMKTSILSSTSVDDFKAKLEQESQIQYPPDI